jgi:hypothetical protein
LNNKTAARILSKQRLQISIETLSFNLSTELNFTFQSRHKFDCVPFFEDSRKLLRSCFENPALCLVESSRHGLGRNPLHWIISAEALLGFNPPLSLPPAPPPLAEPPDNRARYSCSSASAAPHALSLMTSSDDVTNLSSCESCSWRSSACPRGSLASALSMVIRRVRRFDSRGSITTEGSEGAAKRWMTDSRRRLRAMGETGGSTEMRVVQASRARLCRGIVGEVQGEKSVNST